MSYINNYCGKEIKNADNLSQTEYHLLFISVIPKTQKSFVVVAAITLSQYNWFMHNNK